MEKDGKNKLLLGTKMIITAIRTSIMMLLDETEMAGDGALICPLVAAAAAVAGVAATVLLAFVAGWLVDDGSWHWSLSLLVVDDGGTRMSRNLGKSWIKNLRTHGAIR